MSSSRFAKWWLVNANYERATKMMSHHPPSSHFVICPTHWTFDTDFNSWSFVHNSWYRVHSAKNKLKAHMALHVRPDEENKKLSVRGVTIALWYFISRGHQAQALHFLSAVGLLHLILRVVHLNMKASHYAQVLAFYA
uniref:Uncharacterized protein n=1 Tax=Parascaris equorum TaxID=6256 RepID=A0A914SB48_PAREQ